jgi:hypothetical protein
MVTPALVVRRSWSEIFEVFELLALQRVSTLRLRLRISAFQRAASLRSAALSQVVPWRRHER